MPTSRTLAVALATMLAAVALAGCAADTPSATVTPTAEPTPATMTPTPTPTPTPDPADDEHGMVPLECDAPAPSGEIGTNLGYPEVVFTVKEGTEEDPCFGFHGPASVPAGWVAVTLQNDGMQPHIMPMFKVDGMKTDADVREAFSGEDTPSWLTPAGGVGFATPFSSGTSILNLEPGQYLIVCFFAGHHMQGMYRFLEVTEAVGEPLAEPNATYTIEMDDFSFTVPEIPAGKHVVAFKNVGAQPHEAPLIRLTGNATLDDFLAAVEGPGAGGPPPGEGVGGINEIAAGGMAYAIVDFTAGRYATLCFVEDPETHKGHLELGMRAEWTIAEPSAPAS